jgi:hypothetical protein
MRNKVLYFPYINLPNSVWLQRMLLYWDTVGVIMPYQFIEEPNELGEHTQELLRAGLVTQVIPSDYIGEIPNFASAFRSHLENLGTGLERRRRVFRRADVHPAALSRRIHSQKLGVVPIHLEKTSSLALDLIELGLSDYAEYPWLAVEKHTAREFMYYLATVLGHHRELQFSPVTDDVKNLIPPTSFDSKVRRIDESLGSLRLEVLEEVLPIPTTSLAISEIEQFKIRHGDQLGKFRRALEVELIQLAAIKNLELRKRKLELIKEGMVEEIGDIQSKMKSTWAKVTKGGFGALVGAIPVIGTVKSLIDAIFKASGSSEGGNQHSPLAYAAYARRELFRQ